MALPLLFTKPPDLLQSPHRLLRVHSFDHRPSCVVEAVQIPCRVEGLEDLRLLRLGERREVLALEDLEQLFLRDLAGYWVGFSGLLGVALGLVVVVGLLLVLKHHLLLLVGVFLVFLTFLIFLITFL
jgi:hypothetical protein